MTFESYPTYQQVASEDNTCSKDTYEYHEETFHDTTRQQKFPVNKCVMIGSLILAMIFGSSLLMSSQRTDFNRVVCFPDESPLIAPILGTSASSDVIFCKTSCTDACAKFPSVYGDLCCDWATDDEGAKSCAQSVTKEGVCICGAGSGSASKSGGDSDKKPGSTPVQVPSEAKKGKKGDDDDNGGWKPFPPFGGWEPMPGWKPFKPIKVPEGASECQKHCEHPCGWSQSDGKSVCCEKSTDKDCSITQINGKCYCG